MGTSSVLGGLGSLLSIPARDEHAGFAKIAEELGSYNDRWKQSRRLMHPWLHKKAAEDFHSSRPLQTRLLLHRLLESSDHMATLAHYVYGYKPECLDDPLLLNLKEATNNFITAALPSNFLVNLVPALIHVPEWFPGANWKRTACQWREQQEHAVNAAYEWTKAQMVQGEHGGSIVGSLLSDAQRLNLDADVIDDYVKQLAVTMFI
ncbi:hypothetical protein FRC10_010162, partial [Ceratobasidium sp. 414]